MKYRANLILGGGANLGEVEAESKEAALQLVLDTMDTSAPTLCHHCTGHVEDLFADSILVTNVEDSRDYIETDDW